MALIHLAIYILSLTASSMTCPDRCQCNRLTKTIICSGKYLTSVPKGIPVDSEMVILDRNIIQKINKDDFKGLIYLKTLQLHANFIRHIDDYSFKDLGNLSELSLNENYISRLSEKTLFGLGKLTTLWLSKIHPPGIIPCIEDFTFESTPFLKVLHITENDLLYISENLFSGLNNIEVLSLTFNRVSKISEKAFNHLPRTANIYLGDKSTGVCCCSTARAIDSMPRHSYTSCKVEICFDSNFVCQENLTSTCNNDGDTNLISDSSVSDYIMYETSFTTPFLSSSKVHLHETSLIALPKKSTMLNLLPTSSIHSKGISLGSTNNIISTQEPEPEQPSEPRKTGICPTDVCTCYQSSKMVLCSGQHLLRIPRDIPADTKKLILNDNSITRIRKYDFYDLFFLEELHIHNNKISKIDDGSFQDLVNLTSLFLKRNQLNSININTFTGLKNLKVLWLSNMASGEIPCIEDGSFSMLKNLVILQLNGNDFLFLSNQLFSGLESLDNLALSLHRIKVISERAFSQLPKSVTLQSDSYDAMVCCCSTANALQSVKVRGIQSACTQMTCSDNQQICQKSYKSTCEFAANDSITSVAVSVEVEDVHQHKTKDTSFIINQLSRSEIQDEVFNGSLLQSKNSLSSNIKFSTFATQFVQPSPSDMMQANTVMLSLNRGRLTVHVESINSGLSTEVISRTFFNPNVISSTGIVKPSSAYTNDSPNFLRNSSTANITPRGIKWGYNPNNSYNLHVCFHALFLLQSAVIIFILTL